MLKNVVISDCFLESKKKKNPPATATFVSSCRVPVPLNISSHKQIPCEPFWQKNSRVPCIRIYICFKQMICSFCIMYSYTVTSLVQCMYQVLSIVLTITGWRFCVGGLFLNPAVTLRFLKPEPLILPPHTLPFQSHCRAENSPPPT